MVETESEIYGSARLLKEVPYDITATLDPAGSPAMPLGHNPGNHGRGLSFDTERDKGHAITFGRTRGGKGVSSIIPALLTYKGSMVVIDPKGENAWVTAERRRAMGQRVIILDPWNEVNTRYAFKVGAIEPITKFNPLSALDPHSPDFADDVNAIADAFIYNEGNDPHWPDSARELVGGFIAAEVQSHPGKASMRAVRKLLTSKILDILMKVDRTIHEFPDSVAASKLAAAFERDEDGKPLSTKEMSSIRSTARTQTAFLDSARLQESMETDDPPVNLADLGTMPTTLYLVLPVDRLKTHGRWLRMILTLAIRTISKLPTPPNPPVVFMLDELGTISPGSGLSMIEQSYGLMAGMGIRIWAFLQDLPQLKRDYPNSWETFLSNSSIIQLLNVAENTTSSYFSTYLGNKTVNARTGSWTYKQVQWDHNHPDSYGKLVERSGERAREYHMARETPAKLNGPKDPGNPGGMTLLDWFVNSAKIATSERLEKEGKTPFYNTQWTPDEQYASRPVMFPWEIEKADASKCILIRPGQENCQLVRHVYYSDPIFKPLSRPDPKFPDTPIVKAAIPSTQPPPAAPLVAPPTPPPATAPPPTMPSANQNQPARFDTKTGKPLQPEPPDVGAIGKELGSAVSGLLNRLKK